MKRMLTIGAILLAVTVIPARAASPIATWKEGARWDVQLEQLPVWSAVAGEGWRRSFRLQFTVTDRTSREVRVEVTTIPENRFQERLVLRYSPKGEILSARIVDPNRVQDLGSAGGPGVFGMLGREAFVMTKAPEAGSARSVNGARIASTKPAMVAIDKEGRSHQTWRPGKSYWREYATAGVPLRAWRIDGSSRVSVRGNREGSSPRIHTSRVVRVSAPRRSAQRAPMAEVEASGPAR